MRRTLIAAALLLAPAGAHAAIRDWRPARFDRIASSDSYDITVVPGPVASVRAEGDADALGRMDVRVDGASLRIGTKHGLWWGGWHRKPVRVTVVAPFALRSADLAGSGNLTMARVDAPVFEGSISGSGNMVLRGVATRRLALSISGSGDVTAFGHSERVSASIAGSGNARLDELHTVELTADIAGSGDIRAFASRTATLSIVGSGDMRVRGGARCTVSKAGSGSATCTA